MQHFNTKLLERKAIAERITFKIIDFVNTFDEGIGGG